MGVNDFVNCALCGRPIVRGVPWRKYCPECSHIRRREQIRRWQKQNAWRWRIYNARQAEKKRQKELEMILERARKLEEEYWTLPPEKLFDMAGQELFGRRRWKTKRLKFVDMLQQQKI